MDRAKSIKIPTAKAMVKNDGNLAAKVQKDEEENNSNSSKNKKSNNDSEKENQFDKKGVRLQVGIMEIDCNSQLKEVRLTRILVT